MKRLLISGAIIVILVAAGITAWNFWKSKRGVTTAPSDAPIIVQENAVTGVFEMEKTDPVVRKVAIKTQSGDIVKINNFVKESKPINAEGDLAMTPAPDAFTIPDYDIAFYPQGAVFRVSINTGPVDQIRNAAEKKFLEILGISQGEACKLNVYEGISKDIDESYAGINVGLSFCK